MMKELLSGGQVGMIVGRLAKGNCISGRRDQFMPSSICSFGRLLCFLSANI
jgi:hypothetical protein